MSRRANKRAVVASLPARRAIGAPQDSQARASMTIADWYFDFVSPFSYLQCERLPALAPALEVRCKPVVFGAILAANAHKGPAEIAGKRAFTYRFAHLAGAASWASRSSFRTCIRSIRCRCCVSRSPATRGFDAVQRIFRFVWRDGRLPDLPIEWAELAQQLGVHDPDARIAAAEVKDELRRNTDEAIARGVFGVPTLAIGGELFWGVDATDMAREFVAQGCRYIDPEYARVAALPIGVVRARQAGPLHDLRTNPDDARRPAHRSRASSPPSELVCNGSTTNPDDARGDQCIDRLRS